jgi:2'-5' RNA ligase
MLLHGAIVPPRAVLEAVVGVLESVPVPAVAVVETPEPSRRGLLGRLGGRRHEDPGEPAPAVPDVLNHVPVEDLYLPVTEFGNLTTSDAHQLAGVITEAARTWSPVTVHFAGGTALDFPGDWSVWAKLAGDLDPLMAIARGMTQSVEQLGLFVDRRLFRPMLSLATVTEATTGPYLQAVVDAFDAFRGEDWTIDHVTLMTQSFDGTRPVPKEFQRIALGGP